MSHDKPPDIESLAERIERLERENRALKRKVSQTPRISLRDLGPDARAAVDSITGPDAGRRQLLSAMGLLLAGGALVVTSTGEVRAAESVPGAACSWRGDQNANDYGLYNLSELGGDGITGGDDLTNIAGANLSIDADGNLNGQSFAPLDAQYLVAASDPDLTNETVVNNPENVPDWSEDANSPASVSGASDLSYTIDGTYDEVMVRVKELTGGSSSVQDLHFRVNGNTGSNYDYVQRNGSTTTDDGKFIVARYIPDSADAYGVLLLEGRWPNTFSFTNNINAVVGGNAAQVGQNDTISSPLDSFTLVFASGTISGTIEVYGRDMG